MALAAPTLTLFDTEMRGNQRQFGEGGLLGRGVKSSTAGTIFGLDSGISEKLLDKMSFTMKVYLCVFYSNLRADNKLNKVILS